MKTTTVIESFILLTKKIQFAQAPNAFYATDGAAAHLAGRSPTAGVKRPGAEPTWNVDNYLPRKPQSPSFHPSVLSELNRSLLAQGTRLNLLSVNIILLGCDYRNDHFQEIRKNYL